MVRAVLERVMRVKLDMDAVYAADAAAAQEALRVVALETPEHEFLVRLNVSVFGPPALCAVAGLHPLLRAKEMLQKGLNHNMWRFPENIRQKSQSLIRLQWRVVAAHSGRALGALGR